MVSIGGVHTPDLDVCRGYSGIRPFLLPPMENVMITRTYQGTSGRDRVLVAKNYATGREHFPITETVRGRDGDPRRAESQ